MPAMKHEPVPGQRIMSLVPSQTELLFDLGLDDEVVGITKFCIHPTHWFRTKKRVGGTKNVNIDIVDALQPTLILANREENEKQQIESLQQRYPVYISDVATVENAFDMMKEIGELTNTSEHASSIIEMIRQQRKKHRLETQTKTVLYLIWHNPWMAAGKGTFIDSMLEEAGFKNCIQTMRYPMLTDMDIAGLKPDFIFLSSEPFPFKEKHAGQLQQLLPGIPIRMVDGELFSWYGSRMIRSFEYFSILHESLC